MLIITVISVLTILFVNKSRDEKLLKENASLNSNLEKSLNNNGLVDEQLNEPKQIWEEKGFDDFSSYINNCKNTLVDKDGKLIEEKKGEKNSTLRCMVLDDFVAHEKDGKLVLHSNVRKVHPNELVKETVNEDKDKQLTNEDLVFNVDCDYELEKDTYDNNLGEIYQKVKLTKCNFSEENTIMSDWFIASMGNMNLWKVDKKVSEEKNIYFFERCECNEF